MQSVLRGIPASPGIVVGPVHLLRWEVPEVKHRLIDDDAIDAEIVRLHDAFERARDRLRHLRARAEQHEALLKPPDETQLRLHPAYKKLHAHAKEMSDRAQVAEARVQQFRTDAAALNTMRHREQATFDEYRERLASQVGDETKQRSVELAAALADRRTIELQLAQLALSIEVAHECVGKRKSVGLGEAVGAQVENLRGRRH